LFMMQPNKAPCPDSFNKNTSPIFLRTYLVMYFIKRKVEYNRATVKEELS
jgi:hypothetical protein